MKLEDHIKKCKQKNRYPSRSAAMKKKKMCAARSKKTMSVYRCLHCDYYHLTSQERRPINRRLIAKPLPRQGR